MVLGDNGSIMMCLILYTVKPEHNATVLQKIFSHTFHSMDQWQAMLSTNILLIRQHHTKWPTMSGENSWFLKCQKQHKFVIYLYFPYRKTSQPDPRMWLNPALPLPLLQPYFTNDGCHLVHIPGNNTYWNLLNFVVGFSGVILINTI